mgnify:FL=1
MSRFVSQVVLVLLMLAACTPVQSMPDAPVVVLPDATAKPEPSSVVQEPQPSLPPKNEDAALSRAPAYVQSAELLLLESDPPQVVLKLRGNLPTPCHQLRTEIKPPDAENRIEVDVYSVVDPNRICIQVLAAFELDLDLGRFPAGHYSVWVNGKNVGGFDA